MNLVTGEEMRALDQRAINEYGIPGIILMENAGLAVVDIIKQHFAGDLSGKRILLFAGKGNNGGDAFVVARHLANAGCQVKIFLLCKPEELKGDALTNWRILHQMKISHQIIVSERDLNVAKVGLIYTELVVDGIFGTGLQGQVQGVGSKVIDLINKAGKTIVAIDLPSGLEADTGRVHGSCIRADYTVTMGLPKIGLFLEPGASLVGELTIADISFPQELLEPSGFKRFLLDYDLCSNILLPRDIDSHKGSYGHLLVIGGSPYYTGAVAMAAEAGVRSGAGLVTALVPEGIGQILAAKLTEAMILPLPETKAGSLSLSALRLIREKAVDKVAVFGPGLSREEEVGELVAAFIKEIPCPVVFDADALFALGNIKDFPELIKESKYPVIFTPHPGEMAHLMGVDTGKIQKNRIHWALEGAKRHQVVLVLKGAKTIVATPEGKFYLNPTGNPGMATGGSGDVLAGMIGALLAQGIKPEKAAALGVYIHGRAGDLAAGSLSQTSLAAGDLITHLPKIFLDFEGCKK